MQKNIQKILGKNLLAMYEYPKYPTKTLVIIVEKTPFAALQSIKEEIVKTPVICLSLDEIKKGTDVFSLKLFAIQKTAILIFGLDIFSEITIEKEDLRRSVEYDIRNKNIYLRQEAIRIPAKKLIHHIIPELIPVLLGISFLHNNFQSDIETLLQQKTFSKINISPLLELQLLQQKKEYSNTQALDMITSISTMLDEWAEIID